MLESGEVAVLERAEMLIEQGRVVESLDLLAEANRRKPSAELEERLIDLRHQASGVLDSEGRLPWPPVYTDPFPDVHGRLPEIEAPALTGELLGGSVAHHGCLVVRNLFNDEQVKRTIRSISEAESRRGDGTSVDLPFDRWYRPFVKANEMDVVLRRMVARQGGTWLADSPAGAAQVLDDLADSGAIDAVAEHFGERPLFSLQKSTLRRSLPIYNFAGWHQDGSFLGPKARAMNVWVALSPCGGDLPTPGMELVPRRIPDIMPTDGGLGSASIADESVLKAALDTPSIHPEFAPGDAMLFDERFLHRTHLTPNMTTDRYAIECWFFAPSFSAEKYLSFVA